MKLDVGCWHKCPEGYEGLDILDFGQEYVQDIRKGLPDKHWEQIRSSHFIEHLTQQEAMDFINDCHDKCDELYIIVPHLRGDNAWILTHRSYYTEGTFKYFERTDIGDTYFCRRWEIKRMVVNDRNDIHVWMKPV